MKTAYLSAAVAVIAITWGAIAAASVPDGPCPAYPQPQPNNAPNWDPSYPCASEGGHDVWPAEVNNGEWWVMNLFTGGVDIWVPAPPPWNNFLCLDEGEPQWPQPGSRLVTLNADGTYTEYKNVGTAQNPNPQVCGKGNNSF